MMMISKWLVEKVARPGNIWVSNQPAHERVKVWWPKVKESFFFIIIMTTAHLNAIHLTEIYSGKILWNQRPLNQELLTQKKSFHYNF